MASDDSGDQDNGLAAGRRRFLKVCGGSALAAGGTPLITSCGFFKSNPQFEVDVAQWLGKLAFNIGAKQVRNILSGGLRSDWAKWGPDVEAVGEGILEDGVILAASSFSSGAESRPQIFTTSAMEGRYRFIPDGVGYAHPVPPIVMLRASRSKRGDPGTDLLVAFVDGGRKHLVFKPWAWQTLALFVNYLTANQSPADLSVARAVCVLTLVPAGTKPQTGRIPGGLVDWMNYKSRNGDVRIALVQESNGAPTGVITASAIPGGDGRPLVKHFTLPVQAPGTV
jgi:hypothetical protein